VQSETVEDAMKRLIWTALIQLGSSPPKLGYFADIQGTRGARRLTQVMRLIPDAYLGELNAILSDPAVSSLQAAAANDEAIMKSFARLYPTLSPFECLRLIVIMVTKQYLKLAQSLAYDDAVLVDVIRRFIDDVKSGVFKYVRRSPLKRFDMDTERFDISADVTIRRILDSERNDWQDEDGPFRFRDLDADFLIEQRFEADTAVIAAQSPIDEDDIVSILRALKDEGIAMPLTEQRNVSMASSGWHYPKYVVTGNYETDAFFTLDKATRARLSSLFSQLTALKSNARFNLALRRWSIGHDRPDSADKLVDWWIALEALFGTSDSTDQLSQSLAFRISAFIGTSGTYGREFTAAKEAYGTRSKIVHGVPRSVPPEEPGRTRDILRRSLLKMLDRASVPSTEELDKAIRDHRTADF
jgi:hypothetical protein